MRQYRWLNETFHDLAVLYKAVRSEILRGLVFLAKAGIWTPLQTVELFSGRLS